MKKLKVTSVFAVLCLATLALASRAQALTTNIDLRDVVSFGSAQDKAEAQAIINDVNASPLKYGLPEGIAYSKGKLKSIGEFAVSTLEVQNVTGTGYDLFAIYASGKDVVLNKISISSGVVSGIARTDLTKNPPSAQIDILNRQMVLSERKSGFLKFQPVSLGALTNIRMGDESSGYKSLSPVMRRTYLSKSKSELSRTEPEYYQGRPFLRIIDQDQSDYGGFTPFGLHYKISANFERGFVSNGCFRLRDTDLYELSSMVFLSRKNGVPLSIVASSSYGNRHPWPMINDWYNSPRVIADANGRPVFMTIEHGLYQFDKKTGSPEMLLR